MKQGKGKIILAQHEGVLGSGSLTILILNRKFYNGVSGDLYPPVRSSPVPSE